MKNIVYKVQQWSAKHRQWNHWYAFASIERARLDTKDRGEGFRILKVTTEVVT